MKCNKCDYAADYIDDSEVDKKQCDITDEVHEAEFECNCEIQRNMYDKRNRLIMEYENIKAQAVKKVDPKRVIDILTDTAKESSVKIAEAIEYLEEFV